MPKHKSCSVAGCTRSMERHSIRGYCSAHYQRLRTHGDPLSGLAFKGDHLKWIQDHLNHDEDDCLIWPFGRDSRGYARVSSKPGESGLAHVRMCEAVHGPRPGPKHESCHSCGNGRGGCVNPKHLRWDTRAGNQADRRIHGTMIRGRDIYTAKLTEDDVRSIRRMLGTMPKCKIAEIFGVVTTTVGDIERRTTWSWVE